MLIALNGVEIYKGQGCFLTSCHRTEHLSNVINYRIGRDGPSLSRVSLGSVGKVSDIMSNVYKELTETLCYNC